MFNMIALQLLIEDFSGILCIKKCLKHIIFVHFIENDKVMITKLLINLLICVLIIQVTIGCCSKSKLYLI